MKAILIDPTNQYVGGIEIDMNSVRQALLLKTGPNIPVDLTAVTTDCGLVVFYDRNGVLRAPGDFFYIENLSGPIFGKGVVVGESDSEPLNCGDIEALVVFNKARPKVLPKTGHQK